MDRRRSTQEGITEAKSYLTHVNICDSNKLAPGRGNFDFKKIMDIVKRIRYRGYISVEIIQLPRPEIALEEMIKAPRLLLSG